MHSLNKQQYELCAHIMNQIDSNTKPLRIFIEGGVKQFWVELYVKQSIDITIKEQVKIIQVDMC